MHAAFVSNMMYQKHLTYILGNFMTYSSSIILLKRQLVMHLKINNPHTHTHTRICLALLVVVSQRLVVQGQIDLDGGSSSFVVKGMLS